jgi:hypothetical protein
MLNDWDNVSASDGDDNKGGNRVGGSRGGHISEEIYGFSDEDQEPRGLPKGKQDEQANLDHQDS